jgi:hypothetical protein
MKLVPANAKLQKKSTPRTYAKSIDTQKITDLYEEVCTFLDTVERAWQAAERMQVANMIEKLARYRNLSILP